MQSGTSALGLLLALSLPQTPAVPRRGVAEVFRPGAESCWAIEQGAQRLGECVSRYEGEVAIGGLCAHLFRDQVRLEFATPSGKLEQRYTVELWTDAAGHALRFDLRAKVGDARSSVEGALADGKAELVVRQGPSEKRMTPSVPAEVFLLANNFVSHLDLLLALGGEGPWTLFSANVLQAFPYSVKPLEAEAGATRYEDSLGERLSLSSERRLIRVEIPAQQLVMRRVEESVERFTLEAPARPTQAADLEREEVEIVDGDVSLAGTLTRRKGATGKLPGAFFLSGSGPQDREGFSSGIDVGTHEILDRLTREGFLVLRVDDRGVGESSGPTEDLDFGDLVEDGRRVLRFLRARPDVDPERVVALGHSEGALSATVLAAEEGLAALVLMAGPGRPLEDLLREQLLAARSAAGASPDELEVLAGKIDGFLAAVATGAPLDGGALPPELALFVPARAWLASHLGRDPLPYLARVRCPVLLLQGGRDVQVSAERDTPRLLEALAEARHPDHELEVFPDLDHLFKRASDPPSELDYLRARPVAPELLDALVAWLRPRLLE
jgi:pimeloyl-ACP methyl ester carboxylesterase